MNTTLNLVVEANVLREKDVTSSLKFSWREEAFDHFDIDEEGDKRYYNQSDKLHRLDGPAIDRSDGYKAWYIEDIRHRLDGPAVEDAGGTKYWYQNGKLHRLDGPAMERSDGYKAWYIEDIRHRLDGPAIEYANGDKSWYQNGKLHRLDGPAIEEEGSTKSWYQNDKLHRLDGPAIEYANGDKSWYQNDKLHRLDGPAIEYANGDKSWYQNGSGVTEEEFNNRINSQSNLKLSWRESPVMEVVTNQVFDVSSVDKMYGTYFLDTPEFTGSDVMQALRDVREVATELSFDFNAWCADNSLDVSTVVTFDHDFDYMEDILSKEDTGIDFTYELKGTQENLFKLLEYLHTGKSTSYRDGQIILPFLTEEDIYMGIETNTRFSWKNLDIDLDDNTSYYLNVHREEPNVLSITRFDLEKAFNGQGWSSTVYYGRHVILVVWNNDRITVVNDVDNPAGLRRTLRTINRSSNLEYIKYAVVDLVEQRTYSAANINESQCRVDFNLDREPPEFGEMEDGINTEASTKTAWKEHPFDEIKRKFEDILNEVAPNYVNNINGNIIVDSNTRDQIEAVIPIESDIGVGHYIDMLPLILDKLGPTLGHKVSTYSNYILITIWPQFTSSSSNQSAVTKKTHRARSDSYETSEKIPDKDITFISSTGKLDDLALDDIDSLRRVEDRTSTLALSWKEHPHTQWSIDLSRTLSDPFFIKKFFPITQGASISSTIRNDGGISISIPYETNSEERIGRFIEGATSRLSSEIKNIFDYESIQVSIDEYNVDISVYPPKKLKAL